MKAIIELKSRVISVLTEPNAKFLYLSSGIVDQSYPNTNNYKKGKRGSELLCKSSGLDVTIARIYGVIGPGMGAHTVLGNWMKSAAEGKPISVINADHYRSYIDSSECASWLLKILLHGSGTYNVGSAQLFKISSIAQAIGVHMGVPCEVVKGKYTSYSYYPALRLREGELGLEIQVPLMEALAKTCKAFKREYGKKRIKACHPKRDKKLLQASASK
jgi:nucleoside-diphosphate-sugar epimerase